MDDIIRVTLPGGLWTGGLRQQEAGLRPVRGEDEAFLSEEGGHLLPVERVNALLSRCVVYMGRERGVTPETISALTIGDREALLLHLRSISLGDSLRCTADCPDCAETMEMGLDVSNLLLPPYNNSSCSYEATITEGDDNYHVRFRLPIGADQAAAALVASHDLAAAAHLLLSRCIESVTMAKSGEIVTEVPLVVEEKLPDIMARLDPQAEIELNMVCPACGRQFSTLFDAAAFFFAEIASRTGRLFQEVHRLAFYYHWSEAEITGMSTRKRQRYLRILEEALAGGSVG